MQSTDSVESLSNYQWHFFTEVEQNNFTIHMEIQKTLNSQSSIEKEEWSWMSQPFLLWTMGSESESCSVLSVSLWPHGLYRQWDSPDWNTGGGSLSLLQGIFPNQGLNPGLQYCKQILYQLSHREAQEYCSG